MPTADPAVVMLHTLTGNQLKVLIALKILSVGAPILRVATVANLERHAVTAALASLEILGYAEQVGRYVWRLSSASVQLPLWAPAEIDGRNSTIERGSSCLINELTVGLTTTTTTVRRDGRISTIPPADPAAAAVAELLAERTGYGKRAALTWTRAMLAEGYYAGYLKLEILRWCIYCTSKQGQSITNIGAFITRRLSDEQTAPEHVRPQPYSADDALMDQFAAERNAQEQAHEGESHGTQADL